VKLLIHQNKLFILLEMEGILLKGTLITQMVINRIQSKTQNRAKTNIYGIISLHPMTKNI